MKNILFLFALFTFGCLATGCNDDDDKDSTLSFDRAVYILQAEAPLEVTLLASVPASEAFSVPFDITGTAVLDEDYTISARQFEFKPGESSAKIVITPKDNLNEGREIKLALKPVSGYRLWNNKIAMIPIELKERFSCSFMKAKAELTQKLDVEIQISGELNSNSVPSVDLHLPFIFTEATTAELGKHFSIEGDVNEFVIPAGQKKAKISINFLALEAGKDIIELELDPDARFFVGDYNRLTIKIVGPSFYERMLGKWAFKEFASYEFIVGWCEYPNDLDNMPLDNRPDDILEFISGEKDELKVHMTGDLRKYFRDSEVTFLGEIEDEVSDLEDIILLPYMELSNVNVTFSDNQTDIRPARVGFRVLDSGKTLEVHIVDFEPVDFLQDTYADWGDEIAYFYRMRYLFTKVEE
ncbi:hypothetical protein [Gabonibacter chumensis]|uniref:hypothetical protein n=1 Tax=Gabonibacter chumensis TaxID=2972474 RepID=UPI0025734159|nr:hypothetical protein [Gabonibacter chumensis]MCR9011523.1 hypothetical protein [Gabonibacter chumensis]